MSNPEESNSRFAPLEMDSEEFRRLGRRMVDRIADFLASLSGRKVTPGETPHQLRKILGDGPLPQSGAPAEGLLDEAAELLIEHSLFNGHARFWGYITSSAAPIGALADLLASAVNPNVGAFGLAPMATEIELQTLRWIAEMIGFPANGGGVLVSGGNMANFVGFLAARRAKAPWDIPAAGGSGGPKLCAYASEETHTWVKKAADLFGLGTESLRLIPVDSRYRLRIDALRDAIRDDRAAGHVPFLIVGTAGSVSTGAVDPLPAIAEIAAREKLWFHVDGAYGALAAVLPDASADLRGLSLADSVAVDPHKWLYAPVEAGCTLVRDRKALENTFAHRPPYYHFEEDDGAVNFYERGPQNSRGFRALKVWLGLRQAGREGYVRMIADDIALGRRLFEKAAGTAEIETFTNDLSIATFRFVPERLAKSGTESVEYLNALNTELLDRLQNGGEAYVSNAVLNGRFVLRACVVNFRTRAADVDSLPGLIVRLGREVDREREGKPSTEAGIQGRRATNA
ncbi:MAG: pyridoxal phosphate-dependent decarboxylase family protein [Thermoanaerobaculia bacterium]